MYLYTLFWLKRWKVNINNLRFAVFVSTEALARQSSRRVQQSVFRIHDILGWIQIRGSLPLMDPDSDPDADPDPSIVAADLQDANKKLILKKSFLYITF